MSYVRTLIAVADDCPATRSLIPPRRGDKATVAFLQYEMLASAPYTHTQEDVLFQCWLARQEGLEHLDPNEVARLREGFFSKPQACLRASPLPRRYGWGLLFDAHGRIALCAMESIEYQEIVRGQRSGISVIKAMRSRRAGT